MLNRHLLTLGLGFLLSGFGSGKAQAEGALRDPTQPPAQRQRSANGEVFHTASRVSSILISEGRRLAIVAGQAVSVGDLLSEGEVTAIEPGAVVVLGVEGSIRLPLIQRPVTKRPAGSSETPQEGAL